MSWKLKCQQGGSELEPYKMPITSKLQSAYVAGFIDGEGYISLKIGHRKESKYTFYTPIVKIASVEESIISWLKDSFGGWYSKRIAKEETNHRDLYYWTLTGRNLKPFLQAICPYLKIKKKQCELVLRKIKIQETMSDELPYREISQINTQRESKRLSNLAYRDEKRNEIKEIYEELRKLNKKGKSNFAP